MATLSRQTLVEEGLTASYGAAAGGGDQVDNSDGLTVLHVKNGGGGSIDVTVAEQIAGGTTVDSPTYGKLTKASVVKSVGAGAEAFIGPFKKAAFNDANNFIQITYSGVTSVTIAALKFPTI